MVDNTKNAEYWSKRFEEILIEEEKSALVYEKELVKVYKDAIDDIEKELQSFFNTYSQETGLNLAQVRRLLTKAQLSKFKDQQKRYLDKIDELISQGATLDTQSRKLKELFARTKVTRLQQLQNNLNTVVMMLTGQQEVKLTKLLKKSYGRSFRKTVYELQKGLGYGSKFSTPDTQGVMKVIKTKWNGANYSDNIWKNKQKLTNWLNTDLPRHFARGSSVQQMSSDLTRKLNVNYKDAERLVRTEVNYVTNQAVMDGYKEEGVEKYQLLATLDDRTSEICREMDGKIFDVGKEQVAVNYPPFHPRCRTTTVPYFEEDDYDLERAARDKDGNIYYVPANMTYKEWEKKYGN